MEVNNDNPTKSVTKRIFEGTSKKAGMSDEDIKLIDNYIHGVKDFSSIVTEASYIIDFAEQRFRFVANHGLFLGEHTCEEVLQLGFDFYPRTVHPEDLPMLIDAYRAILQYVDASDTDLSDLDYFSFTHRIRSYPHHQHPEYLMVYHRVKPVVIHDKVQIAFCSLSSSIVKKSGNLRIYYETQHTFDEYSFKTKQWKQVEAETLTQQEKLILKLAKQGKTAPEIAKMLNRSYSTVRNEKMNIFHKLHVHTTEEAIIYATNHRLIFT
ncbi:MAG: LuxR C-terminal-related transcriptional regulator [Bacteroidales bacterium]|jgi:DNA-binding CsgD family transcriptional regulator|nr:LuxR C-terminal-related transcriptional regulator [Bacteroidales bacterium]